MRSSYQKEEMSLTDLCHEYDISRPTAYKCIKRYNEVGPEGLLDFSRRPHGCSIRPITERHSLAPASSTRFPSSVPYATPASEEAEHRAYLVPFE